jgi:hypothetical protein
MRYVLGRIALWIAEMLDRSLYPVPDIQVTTSADWQSAR